MKIRNNYSKEEELEFLKKEQVLNPPYIRWIFILFIILYAFFALADFTYYPNNWQILFIIRFAIVIPLLILVIVLSFKQSLSKFHQYYIAFSFFVSGAGIAYMLILHPQNIVYYGGLFMIYFSGYLLIKLRYYYATFSGLAILSFHVIGHFIINNEFSETFIFGTLFYVGANLIGMVGAYQFEVKNRKQFLYKREITRKNIELKREYMEKEEQLVKLEQSIKENEELIAKNRELDFLTKSLKESEDRFRILHNASFGGIVLHDKGLILDCNQGLSDITGFSIDELVGMDGLLLIAADYRDYVMSKILSGYEEPYEVFGIRKNKEIYPLKLEARNIPYMGKQVRVVEFRDFTELKIANQKLSESEEKYRTLHDTMIQGVVYQDRNGYIFSCNKAAEEILGLSIDQMQGKTSMDPRWKMIDEDGKLVSGENHPSMIALRTKEKVGPVVRGVYHPEKDTYVWLNIIAIPLFKGEEKKPFQVYATLEDITERKLILDQLKRKEKQLLDSQSISQVGSFRLDLITNEIGWTDEVYKMFGFDPTLPAIPYEEQVKTYTKESWEKLSNAVDLTATKGIGYSLELEIVRQDGSTGWIWVKGEAEKDKQGEIIAILGVAQDITERKEQEEKLKQSEEQYRLLTSEMQLGLALHEIICDDEGNPIDYRFVEVNESYERLTGLRKRDIIGKRILEVLPNIEKYWIEQFGKIAIHGGTTRYENYVAELQKYFSTSVYSPKKGQFAVVSEDITEKKKQEDFIKHTQRHDSLTKIPNRLYYDEQLTEMNSKELYPLAILIMDINGLKLINDSFGQEAGDRLLKQFANILLKEKREEDFIARISGDEFVMLCPKTSFEVINGIRQMISDSVSTQRIENMEYSIATGVAIQNKTTQDITKIVVEAENAMYRNKIVYGQSTRSEAIESVFSTLTNKYAYEKIHSERVARYSRLIGEQLNMHVEELDELELAGRLHDIGKIAISDDIIMKPGSLTNEEWQKIKDHTIIGYQILRAADKYSNLADYAMSHHERIDGKGYPNGLKGNNIPLFARIICVADSYEAMTSNRTYRKALKEEEAVQELTDNSGTQFDPEIVDIFITKVLHIQIV